MEPGELPLKLFTANSANSPRVDSPSLSKMSVKWRIADLFNISQEAARHHINEDTIRR